MLNNKNKFFKIKEFIYYINLDKYVFFNIFHLSFI